MGKEKKRDTRSIASWPVDDRPREKLLRLGAHTLSNTELLAILLRTGTNGRSAVELARNLIEDFGTLRNLGERSFTELRRKGLGVAKIAQVKAALELGRRFSNERKLPGTEMKTSKDIADYFMVQMRDLKKENFKILLLNGKNRVMKVVAVSEGTLTKSIVHPREVLKEAIVESAAALVLVHNHPSGDSHPSDDDKKITRRLVSACGLMGIRILDHIIIGADSYFSFFNEGLIREDDYV